MSSVRLVEFTPELLPVVQPWFEHPEVRRRLGGPDRPVAHLGGEVYDRWTAWDPAREEVLAVHPGRATGVAYVVDPARWGRGVGRAALRALLAAAAGFAPLSERPDAEGTVDVRWTREDA